MRFGVALALIAFLVGCNSDDQVPANVIPVKRMQTIMWQLMQSDEYVNMLVTKDSTKKSSAERAKRYEEIFALNQVSQDEFKKSYQYYLQHPEITKLMFDSITAIAQRQRSELYKPKPDTALKHLKDSSIRRPAPLQ